MRELKFRAWANGNKKYCEYVDYSGQKITIPIDWFYELREKADEYEKIMEKRKKASEKSRASLMKNMTAEERKIRALKAVQARWGKNIVIK